MTIHDKREGNTMAISSWNINIGALLTTTLLAFGLSGCNDDPAKNINCADSTTVSGHFCDGIADCSDASDERFCGASFSAQLRSQHALYKNAPVSIGLQGLTPSNVDVSIAGEIMDTIERDGMVAFLLPELPKGNHTIKVTNIQNSNDHVFVAIEVELPPQILSANEAINQFSNDSQQMLEASESTFNNANNFDVPEPLLPANESFNNAANESAQLLDANEKEKVASTVGGVKLLMGAESPRSSSPKQQQNLSTCATLRDDLISYADRVRAGVNLISLTLTSQSKQNISAEAKRTTAGFIYAYWTYLLSNALGAYDDYVTRCARESLEIINPNTGNTYPSFDTGDGKEVSFVRVGQVDDPAVRDSILGCKVALEDATVALADYLGLNNPLDFSAMIPENWSWRWPMDNVMSDSVRADGDPSLTTGYGDNFLSFDYNSPILYTNTIDALLLVADYSQQVILQSAITVEVPGIFEPSGCNSSTPAIKAGDTYFLGFPSQFDTDPGMVIRMEVTNNTSPEGDLSLRLTPLVSEQCVNVQSTSPPPWCHGDTAKDGPEGPRNPGAEPRSVMVNSAQRPINIELNNYTIRNSALRVFDDAETHTIDLHLQFSPCYQEQAGEPPYLCGVGAWTTDSGIMHTSAFAGTWFDPDSFDELRRSCGPTPP